MPISDDLRYRNRRKNNMSKIVIDNNIHALLNPGSVVLISAKDKQNEGIFAVTWNMPVKKEPAMVAFESSQNHFTYSIIKSTGEFAVNIPHAAMVNQVLGCGQISGKTGVDKFKRFNMSKDKSHKTDLPLVKEAFANLECKVVQIVDMGASAIVIGHVVRAIVEEEHYKNGQITFENGLQLLHHLGGNRFCISERVIEGKSV
jgi:flavin reductase (DIM6/NTAB) family NADH-FMN oxidoreductase RutF